MENEVLNTIFARSSIRAYTDEPLTREEMTTLADVALASPTAMNRQTQRYYFITDKSFIDEWEQAVADEIIKEGSPELCQKMSQRKNKIFYNAPLFIAIAVDKTGKFSMADAGIAAENIAIAAKSIGLDTVILGLPDMAFAGDKAQYLKDKAGIPAELDFALGIAVGHAAMDKAPHDTDSTHVIYIK